jgi:diguanylate cyclase
LKIDRSLIREMQTDRSASDMVEMIITLAHKMNLRVIAEGIETARQFERLRELGCEFGQGYYFSQALEATTVGPFCSRMWRYHGGLGFRHRRLFRQVKSCDSKQST